jgi:hypothetical protein
MTAYVLQAGARLEIPSVHEVADEVSRREAERERERARTVKPIRYVEAPSNLGTVSSVFMGDASPESGYVWALMLLSVQLASAGNVQAYVTSSAPSTGLTPQRLIANLNTATTTQYVQPYSKGQVFIFAGEGLYLKASQNIVAVYLNATEVMSEMVFKLLL